MVTRPFGTIVDNTIKPAVLKWHFGAFASTTAYGETVRRPDGSTAAYVKKYHSKREATVWIVSYEKEKDNWQFFPCSHGCGAFPAKCRALAWNLARYGKAK